MENKELVCGVGFNDADYVVQKREAIIVTGKQSRKIVWFCPYYRTWKSMLNRCYSTKFHERQPTYKGCSVSEEWLTFSVFKNWMEKQDWQDNQLDKDLLIEGNKVYSPETCVFVSGMVNSFTVDGGASRGEWPIGVYWDKGSNKFKSQCRNPITNKKEYLGLFTCEQEAHQAWVRRKMELAKELAAIQTDPRVAEALINRYSNYRRNIIWVLPFKNQSL